MLHDRLFYSAPSRILFGNGVRRDLAPLLARQGFRHGLIVTDRFFTEKSPIIEELRGLLREHGITSSVSAEGEPDPSVALCLKVQGHVRGSGEQDRIDHLIAVGGGSNIDLAKVLSLTLKYGGEPEDYIGEGRIPGKPLPLVAIPTTAGTGSEITAGAILVKHDSDTKVAVMANDLRPAVAVVDPELTLSCPPRVTADAGLDALTHAIESYLTIDSPQFDRQGEADPAYTGRNAMTMLFAAESVRLCFRHLPAAMRDGTNLEARTGMAYGSLFAGLSYASAGLNGVHALAYALAGLTHATHGSTNAVFLPYVMDALRPVRQAELAEIARMAGETGGCDAALALRAVERTRELVEMAGIPTTLPGFGVREEQIEPLARNGIAVARLTRAFPIQPADAAYRRIVANAFSGRLGDAG
ncbi:iron-containing alcohol dehydrogenase [Azospirillum brasilense]|nr:iron-containing alcohol dehydrogenase [Azospirillum brasilense]